MNIRNKIKLFVGVVLISVAVISMVLIGSQVTLADAVDLYWIGGTGNWSDTAHWATDAGGGGAGHAVPTSTNKVIFGASSDSGSGFTVTINTSANCADWDSSGVDQVMTVAGSSAISIYGGVIWKSDHVRTYTGAITFASTATGKDINFAGVSLGSNLTFNGAAGGWTLQNTLTTTGTLTMTNGTFDTNDYAVSTGNVLNATGTSALTLGSTTWTCSGSWNLSAATTTLTADTSVLIFTGAATQFTGGGKTYYEVQFNGSGNVAVLDASNSFTNLTRTGTAVTTDHIIFSGSQTIIGTLTLAGNSVGNRLSCESNTVVVRTLTSAANTFSNVDFYYIGGAGAGSWNVTAISGLSANMGGNTGITFNNKSYWVGASGSWGGGTCWSGTSGGTTHANWTPNSEVDAYFDANSSGTTVSVTSMSGSCKDLDMTGAPPVDFYSNGYTQTVWGNIKLLSTFTCSGPWGGGYWDWRGVGKTIDIGTGIVSVGGTSGYIRLYGSYTLTSSTFTAYGDLMTQSGSSFTATSKTITVGTMSLGSGTTSADLTNSTINCSVWSVQATVANTTLTGTTINYSGGTNFTGGGDTYNIVNLTTPSGTVTMSGANTFATLTVIGKNYPGTAFVLSGDQVVTGTLTCTGYNSTTRRLALGSSVLGTQRQVTAAVVHFSDCNISDWAGVGAAAPFDAYTHLNSDFGNNLGITFSLAQNNYWVGNSGNWSDVTHWASSSGGIGGTGRVPVIQDTAIFDTSSFTIPGRTVTIDMTDLSSINASAVTNTPTISKSGQIDIYGSLNLGTVTYSVTTTYFKGANNVTLISGSILTTAFYIEKNPTIMASVSLGGDVTVSGTVYLLSGVLNLNNYNLTASVFNSSDTTYDRALTMGSGIFTLNGTTATTKWNVAATKLTVYCNTSTIYLTNSTANAQSFTPGSGITYYNLMIAGSGNYTLTFNASFSLNSLYVDRSSAAKSLAGNYTLTMTGSFYCPTSGTTVLSIANIDISKTSGSVVLDWLSFTSGANTCIASGGATFYAGVNSIGSPQTGWNFSSPSAPTVTTVSVTNVLTSSATFTGNVTSLGGYGTVYGYFIYGTDPTFTTYSTTAPTSTMTGTGTFTFTVTGLSPTYTYYFEAAVGDGSAALAYGSPLSFTPGLATVTTLAANPITQTTATLNGNLSALGSYSYAVVYFNWGTTTAYGNSTPTQSFTTSSSFNATIGSTTPLVAGVTYHFCAIGVVTNSAGTATTVSGSDLSFTTSAQVIIPVTQQPYSPVSGSGTTSSSGAIPVMGQPSTWWANGGSVTSLPFYANFDAAATAINPNNASTNPHRTTVVLYLMAILATAMAAGYGVLLFTSSSVLALGTMAVTMGIGASMTIVSGWMVFLVLLAGGVLWFLAKYI